MFEDKTCKPLQSVLYKYVHISDSSAEFGAANWGTGNPDLLGGSREDKWEECSYLCSPTYPWRGRLLYVSLV